VYKPCLGRDQVQAGYIVPDSAISTTQNKMKKKKLDRFVKVLILGLLTSYTMFMQPKITLVIE
jgi:hypothetical protein